MAKSWQSPRTDLAAFCAGLVATLVTTSAQAQNDIVVSGMSLPLPQSAAAYDVAEISRDRLSSSATNRLEDLLRDVAGFAQFRRSDSTSAQPTSQGATLRGLGGNAASRALVLLDGVPFVDPFGGWVTYSAIDPQRLGLVRVTRGGGSGVAGPGALAGTIELASVNAAQLRGPWADLAYGSRKSLDAHAGVSSAMDEGFGFLAASYQRGDGFVPIITPNRGPVDVAAPYEQASLAGRAVIGFGGGSELQAAMLGFYDHRTRGTAFTPNSTKGADASLRLVGRGRWAYEATVYGQIRKLSAGFATIDATRSAVIQSLEQYAVPSTGIGGRFEIRPPLGRALQLRLGADSRYVTGETDEYYQYLAGAPLDKRAAGGRSLTVGAFAETSAEPVERMMLTAGGRIDRWRILDGFLHQSVIASGAALPGTQAYGDRSGTRPTVRSGVAYKPGSGSLTARAAAYLGWRRPTLNELYRPYRVGQDSTVANPSLDPERLKGLDGGLDFDPSPGLHLAATGFYNRLRGAVGNVTLLGAQRSALCPGLAVTGRCYQRQNLDAIASAGAEVEARFRRDAWSVAASYAYTDAHVHAPGQPLDGREPAQTARHQASATAEWGSSVAHLSATLRYVSAQYEDDLNTLALKGAVTLDGTVRIPVRRDLAVELRGENITDTRVEAGVSGANVIERATPRTLWIGLRFGESR